MMNEIKKRHFVRLSEIIGLLICLFVVMIRCQSPSEQPLIHYAAIEPQSEYPRGFGISPRYLVYAKPAGDSSKWENIHQTTAYEAWPDYLDPESIPSAYRDISVHFAQVDANQRLRFRVEMLTGMIRRINLVPSRYVEIQETLSQGDTWVEFELDPGELTKHVLVEINEPNDSPVLNHGLMIFLNPKVSKPAGKVLELPPGIITPESPLMSDDRCIHIWEDSPYDVLYVPQNTLIDGRIQVHKPGFSVVGRGILCGSSWKSAKQDNWRNTYPITADHEIVKGLCAGAGDTRFEGIMTIHPYHFNFTDAMYFTNLKAFGWRYSSDGFHGKYIRGCFAKVNDDHQYTNEGVVEHGSYWGMNNGAIFQLGWGSAAIAPGGDCVVKSCNVLRTEWTADGGERQNNGVFSGVIRAEGVMQNNLFEDIRVDGQAFRFIGYRLGKDVALKDFTFKDIWFKNNLAVPQGYNKSGSPIPNHLVAGKGITGFRFENVVVGGALISSLNDLEPIETENLDEVHFSQ